MRVCNHCFDHLTTAGGSTGSAGSSVGAGGDDESSGEDLSDDDDVGHAGDHEQYDQVVSE